MQSQRSPALGTEDPTGPLPLDLSSRGAETCPPSLPTSPHVSPAQYTVFLSPIPVRCQALRQVCPGLERTASLKRCPAALMESSHVSQLGRTSQQFPVLVKGWPMHLLKQAFLWNAFEENGNEHFPYAFNNLQTLDIVNAMCQEHVCVSI